MGTQRLHTASYTIMMMLIWCINAKIISYVFIVSHFNILNVFLRCHFLFLGDRFSLVSCPSVLSACLSVTLVYRGQMVGRIKMKLGMEVGLGPGYIVLDGDPAPIPQKGHSPQFMAHVCCGQTAG